MGYSYRKTNLNTGSVQAPSGSMILAAPPVALEKPSWLTREPELRRSQRPAPVQRALDQLPEHSRDLLPDRLQARQLHGTMNCRPHNRADFPPMLRFWVKMIRENEQLWFAIIAYRLQADRFGDLDHETKQVLDRTAAKETGPAMSARLASFDQKRTELTPGTVLVREWDRQSQRVIVMADGFAWNGQTYDSLSKVAFAITGTKWNGPRFFGLRDNGDRSMVEARS